MRISMWLGTEAHSAGLLPQPPGMAMMQENGVPFFGLC